METTVEEILNWLERTGVTRKDLAARMGMHYNSLCAILTGAAPLSAKRANVINSIMKEHDEQVHVTLSPEMRAKVEAWAAMMHRHVDEVVEMLLSDAMNKGVVPSVSEDAVTLPAPSAMPRPYMADAPAAHGGNGFMC